MKKYIAHRGNVSGKNSEKENHPDYIVSAIMLGYDVEINVWFEDRKWILGHDEPTYEVTYDFFSRWSNWLWLHAKSYLALQRLFETSKTQLNYFYHTNEDYVLTSQHWIWAYPNKPGNSRTICVLPEIATTLTNEQISKFDGICSDEIEKYKRNAQQQQ